jgi:hypothetical protein
MTFDDMMFFDVFHRHPTGYGFWRFSAQNENGMWEEFVCPGRISFSAAKDLARERFPYVDVIYVMS